MIPDDDALACRRYAIIQSCSAAGVVLMLLGLWIWLGGPIRSDGAPEFGLPLFVLGAVVSMLVPRLLARRWRTPPRP